MTQYDENQNQQGTEQDVGETQQFEPPKAPDVQETPIPQPTKPTRKRTEIRIDPAKLDAPILEDGDERWDKVTVQKKKKKKRRPIRGVLGVFGVILRFLVILLLLVALAVGAMFAVFAAGDMFGLSESEEKIELTIEPNTSVTAVADMLEEQGVIDYAVVFRAYIRYSLDNEVNFSYGNFVVTPNMSYNELITELERTSESNAEVDITFPEGFNVVQIAERLQENHVCTKEEFLTAVNTEVFEYEFLTSAYENREGKAYVLEGYLFPDTYTFLENSEPRDVIVRFLENFDRKYTDIMRNVTANKGFTIDEMITIASIVQQEAPHKESMLNVSSVYHNRLVDSATFPKLQADPTGRYADRTLAVNGIDPAVVTAYDTYLSDGLPPGAIANPGIDAIQSALYPNETEYYYFCSNLETQEFFYAYTYDQHQQNLVLAGLTE